MDGELLIKGYKFPKDIHVNLRAKTILTGADHFSAFEFFNLIENYFNHKNFSDGFIDAGVSVILNGNVLSGNEFAVFRIPPIVNMVDEIKIAKKSLLGQMLESNVSLSDLEKQRLKTVLDETILDKIADLIRDFGIVVTCDEMNVTNLSKIFTTSIVGEGGKAILPQELDQFRCKTFLLDLIEKYRTPKKKILLIEYPEYGLKESERNVWFGQLAASPIDNIVIYSRDMQIVNAVRDILCYHVVTDGGFVGFDEYDLLEKQLQEAYPSLSSENLMQVVLKSLFGQSRCESSSELVQTVKEYINNGN